MWERVARLEADVAGHWRLDDERFSSQSREVERLNGVRRALEDQAARTERLMLPRAEYDVQHAALVDKFEQLRAFHVNDVANVRSQFSKDIDTVTERVSKLELARIESTAVQLAHDRARARVIAVAAVLGSFAGAIAVIALRLFA